MSAPECRKPSRTGTCIEALADGWILPGDLCAACTQAFMSALDSIGEPLKWHHAYLDRGHDELSTVETSPARTGFRGK